MTRILTALLMSLLLTLPAAAEGGVVTDFLDGSGSTWQESILGSAAADALAARSGAEAAILPGGTVLGNLRGGAVTEAEVLRALDDSMALAVAEVTIEDLARLLEDGLSHITLTPEERLDPQASSWARFPQISGFSLEIDASGPVGSRVWELNLPEESGETLMLCTSKAWLEELGISAEPIPGTPAELMLAYIEAGGLEKMPSKGRIRVLGTMDDNFMETFPLPAALVVLGLVLVFAIRHVRVNGRPAGKRYGTR